MKRIKVLKVEPMKYPEIVELDTDLKSLQEAVDGFIDIVKISDTAAILLNDEGKLIPLAGNRRMKDKYGNTVDVIAGTFYVCGDDGETLTDLSNVDMAIYYNYFYEPEEIDANEVQSFVKLDFIGL